MKIMLVTPSAFMYMFIPTVYSVQNNVVYVNKRICLRTCGMMLFQMLNLYAVGPHSYVQVHRAGVFDTENLLNKRRFVDSSNHATAVKH